jgi:signal peptidase I
MSTSAAHGRHRAPALSRIKANEGSAGVGAASGAVDTGPPGGTEPAPTSPSARSRGRAGRRIRRALTGLAVTVLILVVSSLTGLLPVQTMRVGSASMSPTIETHDLVLLERGRVPVHRMDVVAARHPFSEALLVKRAVGVGGDEVSIDDGVLVVNGAAVCEPSIDPAQLDGVWFGPVTVPDGQLFLLGDDRSSSIDSRKFGTVPADAIEGLVIGRLWPSPGPLPVDHC